MAASDEAVIFPGLGKLVWQGIPYDYDDGGPIVVDLQQAPQVLSVVGTIKGDPDKLKSILVDGPAKDYGGDDAYGPVKHVGKNEKAGEVSEESMRKKPWESLWWSFDGQQYRVTKAIMVPYTVKDMNGSGTTLRHLLIGYMGVDSNGG